MGQSLNNLANVYRAQGKYGEAEDAPQARVGDPRNKRSVRTTPTWAQTLTNLANVYRDQGKYGEAEGL